MFINFSSSSDIFDVVIEFYIGDQKIGSQKLSGPKELIMINFIQTVQNVRSDQPVKVVMTRYEDVWDQFDNCFKKQEYSITFWNRQETW